MKKVLHVRFANINQINLGTRVLYAGRPVGEVTKIEEVPNARNLPPDKEGVVFTYELTLKIDSHIVVYTTDQISLQTSGLLGEKSIAIIPVTPPPGVTPVPVGEQPLYAESADPFKEIVDQLSSLGHKVEGAVDDLQHWFDQNSDNISFAIRSFGCTMDQASITLRDINDKRVVDDFQCAAQNFTITLRQIQDAISQLNANDTFHNAGIMMSNLKNASHSIDRITQDLADGKGTLGRLLKGDEMYLRMTAILSKVDTLMNDVNHYGIFFNLNKNWQRLRMQRATLMDALCSPGEFRDYFEQEIDQINTSMGRLSELIHRAENSPDKQEIFETAPFKRDFAELLREVEDLSSTLRLYNEQLMEAQPD
jgi:phospholipid/cholesterol/gamma-HCH transport system substrate-binding protein